MTKSSKAALAKALAKTTTPQTLGNALGETTRAKTAASVRNEIAKRAKNGLDTEDQEARLANLTD
jgi:hypothetical protein